MDTFCPAVATQENNSDLRSIEYLSKTLGLVSLLLSPCVLQSFHTIFVYEQVPSGKFLSSTLKVYL